MSRAAIETHLNDLRRTLNQDPKKRCDFTRLPSLGGVLVMVTDRTNFKAYFYENASLYEKENTKIVKAYPVDLEHAAGYDPMGPTVCIRITENMIRGYHDSPSDELLLQHITKNGLRHTQSIYPFVNKTFFIEQLSPDNTSSFCRFLFEPSIIDNALAQGAEAKLLPATVTLPARLKLVTQLMITAKALQESAFTLAQIRCLLSPNNVAVTDKLELVVFHGGTTLDTSRLPDPSQVYMYRHNATWLKRFLLHTPVSHRSDQKSDQAIIDLLVPLIIHLLSASSTNINTRRMEHFNQLCEKSEKQPHSQAYLLEHIDKVLRIPLCLDEIVGGATPVDNQTNCLIKLMLGLCQSTSGSHQRFKPTLAALASCFIQLVTTPAKPLHPAAQAKSYSSQTELGSSTLATAAEAALCATAGISEEANISKAVAIRGYKLIVLYRLLFHKDTLEPIDLYLLDCFNHDANLQYLFQAIFQLELYEAFRQLATLQTHRHACALPILLACEHEVKRKFCDDPIYRKRILCLAAHELLTPPHASTLLAENAVLLKHIDQLTLLLQHARSLPNPHYFLDSSQWFTQQPDGQPCKDPKLIIDFLLSHPDSLQLLECDDKTRMLNQRDMATQFQDWLHTTAAQRHKVVIGTASVWHQPQPAGASGVSTAKRSVTP